MVKGSRQLVLKLKRYRYPATAGRVEVRRGADRVSARTFPGVSFLAPEFVFPDRTGYCSTICSLVFIQQVDLLHYTCSIKAQVLEST